MFKGLAPCFQAMIQCFLTNFTVIMVWVLKSSLFFLKPSPLFISQSIIFLPLLLLRVKSILFFVAGGGGQGGVLLLVLLFSEPAHCCGEALPCLASFKPRTPEDKYTILVIKAKNMCTCCIPLKSQQAGTALGK